MKRANSSSSGLSRAAALLDESHDGLAGLSTVLRLLDAQPDPPEDLTEWLCARLRAHRPPVALDYTEPVLEGLVMKCDEFGGIHMLKSERPHPECWNLRKMDGDLPIYGVGQCHLDGILHVARHMRQHEGYAKVLWFNMREEPVVFLDGKACAPRLEGALNENVDYLLAIEGFELDAMERRLRDDCVAASNSPSGLSVYFEGGSGNELRPWSTSGRHASGKSFPVREAYDWVNAQPGTARVEYVRVPIADETAPEEKERACGGQDFDQLVTALKPFVTATADAACDTALVFNCHMGRGRTTTGMVCASILTLAARGWAPPEGAPLALPAPDACGRDPARGEYASILQLLQVVDQAAHRPELEPTPSKFKQRRVSLRTGLSSLGVKAKLLVDHCAHDCKHTQHLVRSVSDCVQKASAVPEASRAAFWRHRALKYLERYAYVLLFASYALLAAGTSFDTTFSEWTRRHWHFKRALKDLSVEDESAPSLDRQGSLASS